MNEQENFENTIRILASLNDVPPPNPLRQASARRAFLAHAARLRSEREQRKGGLFPRSFRLAAGSLGAFVLTLGMLTGVVYAADGARPGDLLYPIDRVSEDVRLSLTQDPNVAVRLLLALAEERLVESEQLASEDDLENMAVALEAYSQTITIIAQNADSRGTDQEALSALIDRVLSVHEERLQAIHDQVPAYAYPGLDQAIEAARKAHEKNEQNKNSPYDPGPAKNKLGLGQSNSAPDPNTKMKKPGGPPEDNPGHGPPESSPGPPESSPGPPESSPGPPESSPGPPESPGPPD